MHKELVLTQITKHEHPAGSLLWVHTTKRRERDTLIKNVTATREIMQEVNTNCVFVCQNSGACEQSVLVPVLLSPGRNLACCGIRDLATIP